MQPVLVGPPNAFPNIPTLFSVPRQRELCLPHHKRLTSPSHFHFSHPLHTTQPSNTDTPISSLIHLHCITSSAGIHLQKISYPAPSTNSFLIPVVVITTTTPTASCLSTVPPTSSKRKQMSIRSSNSMASTQVSQMCIIKLHQFSSTTTWRSRACGNWLVISSAPEQMADLQR